MGIAWLIGGVLACVGAAAGVVITRLRVEREIAELKHVYGAVIRNQKLALGIGLDAKRFRDQWAVQDHLLRVSPFDPQRKTLNRRRVWR